MNLTYIKNFLQSRKNGLSKADVETLITEINTFLGTENTLSDISSVMRVINEYNTAYLSAVQDYHNTPELSSFIVKRAHQAREILCILSALHTYLTISISTINNSTYNLNSVGKYLRDLADKKEHYKSEKMTWITILKSLTQEEDYIVEMRRMDIEYPEKGRKS